MNWTCGQNHYKFCSPMLGEPSIIRWTSFMNDPLTHFCLCKFNKFQYYIPFYVRNIRRKLHKSISKFTHSRVYILLCDFICDSKNIRTKTFYLLLCVSLFYFIFILSSSSYIFTVTKKKSHQRASKMWDPWNDYS